MPALSQTHSNEKLLESEVSPPPSLLLEKKEFSVGPFGVNSIHARLGEDKIHGDLVIPGRLRAARRREVRVRRSKKSYCGFEPKL